MTELFDETQLHKDEKRGLGIMGIVEMNDEKYEAEFMPTNERLFVSVAMPEAPYHRVVEYNEVKSIEAEDDAVILDLSIGEIKISAIGNGAAQVFMSYITDRLKEEAE